MAKAKITYQSREELSGKHMQSGEWIYYTGELTVYDRKTKPVLFSIRSVYWDLFIPDSMEQEKEFYGKSISEVYGKISKWFFKYRIILQS
jgi:hypothetical protein